MRGSYSTRQPLRPATRCRATCGVRCCCSCPAGAAASRRCRRTWAWNAARSSAGWRTTDRASRPSSTTCARNSPCATCWRATARWPRSRGCWASARPAGCRAGSMRSTAAARRPAARGGGRRAALRPRAIDVENRSSSHEQERALATFPPPDASGAPRDLLLKVTPPRVPRHLVSRARLLSSADALRDHAVCVVQAPSGFGKTSLLAQWRLEYLGLGVPVGWVSAQSQDDPGRLVQSLALALRVAMGRPAFGRSLFQDDRPGTLGSVTALLAELAQAALNVVLVIDEADRLTLASRGALAYLLRNAPSNVRT
eukprot:Opistho-2@45552